MQQHTCYLSISISCCFNLILYPLHSFSELLVLTLQIRVLLNLNSYFEIITFISVISNNYKNTNNQIPCNEGL